MKIKSLIRKELKIGPGEVRGKEINRPISLGKESFSKKRSVGKLTSLLDRSFPQKNKPRRTK